MIGLRDNMSLCVIKRQCAEWKSLFKNEIESRHKLGTLHRLENENIRYNLKNPLYISGVKRRQLCELNELREINREERIILTEKQFRENSNY